MMEKMTKVPIKILYFLRKASILFLAKIQKLSQPLLFLRLINTYNFVKNIFPEWKEIYCVFFGNDFNKPMTLTIAQVPSRMINGQKLISTEAKQAMLAPIIFIT